MIPQHLDPLHLFEALSFLRRTNKPRAQPCGTCITGTLHFDGCWKSLCCSKATGQRNVAMFQPHLLPHQKRELLAHSPHPHPHDGTCQASSAWHAVAVCCLAQHHDTAKQQVFDYSCSCHLPLKAFCQGKCSLLALALTGLRVLSTLVKNPIAGAMCKSPRKSAGIVAAIHCRHGHLLPEQRQAVLPHG